MQGKVTLSKTDRRKAVNRTFVLVKNGTSITDARRIVAGELDLSPNTLLNWQNKFNMSSPIFSRTSHLIQSLTEDGDNYVGKAKILSTPMGEIVKSLLADGARLGVSSRGMGSLKASKREGGTQLVQSDFQLATAADIVADPSAPDAFVNGVMEGVEWIWDNGVIKAQKIEEYKHSIRRAKTHKLQEVKLRAFSDFLENL